MGISPELMQHLHLICAQLFWESSREEAFGNRRPLGVTQAEQNQPAT